MPSYVLVKSGERVRADSNAKRDALLAQGYVVETDPEQDPRDKESAVGVNVSKGTFKLPVKASPPAGPNVVGELYVATGGVVKVCTVAGSPGTWVSVGAQT
jgi:hypothetical protein